MAMDYLAIPASSAPSKRLFSMDGDVITKRNRPDAEMVIALMCLRSWGVLGRAVDEDDDEDDIVEAWLQP